MDLLEIGLLGGFHLTSASGTTATLGTSRPEKLLAYLLLRNGTPQPRRRLAFLFWPDSAEGQAQTNLRRELHRLRRLLPQTEGLILVEDHLLGLRPGAASSDVERFDREIDTARRRGGEAELEGLRRAVEIYRGELLPEFYDDWVLEERERLHERYVGGLERICELLEQGDRLNEALEYARRWHHADPLSERAVTVLMGLLTRHGDRPLALDLFARYTSRLARETGLEPGPELWELRQRLTRRR